MGITVPVTTSVQQQRALRLAMDTAAKRVLRSHPSTAKFSQVPPTGIAAWSFLGGKIPEVHREAKD